MKTTLLTIAPRTAASMPADFRRADSGLAGAAAPAATQAQSSSTAASKSTVKKSKKGTKKSANAKTSDSTGAAAVKK